MPTYQYECSVCQHTFEAFQSITEEKLRQCPECGELELHRLIGSGVGIIFKGNGFYETDYKRKKTSSGESSKAVSQRTSKDEKLEPCARLGKEEGCCSQCPVKQ